MGGNPGTFLRNLNQERIVLVVAVLIFAAAVIGLPGFLTAANLIAIAYLLGWLKSNPWRPHKPARTPAPEAQGQAQGGARWGNAVPAPGSAE